MKDCVGISMDMLHEASELNKASSGRNSPLEDDLFAWKYVSKELMDHELGLFASKWFDYRQLTPLQATRLYIQAYGDIYRRHYRANFDRRAAEHVKPLSVDGIWAGLLENISKSRRAFIGCWRGRQIADFLCMPYEVYIDLALQFRLNYWQQRNMPQPTHLYSEMVVEKVQERWEELQTRKLYLAEDNAYIVQNYVGARHQDDYHEWLMTQAGKRTNPAQFLARFIEDDLLPKEKVEARYDEFMLERVNRYLQ